MCTVCVSLVSDALTPAEGDGARPVGSFLHKRLVELAARARVDRRPAVLAIILKTDIVQLLFYVNKREIVVLNRTGIDQPVRLT